MGWSIKHCQICLTPETVIRRPKATRSFGKMGLFRGLEWKIFVKMENPFSALQYVSERAIKGSPFPANSIIVATSATIGEHALLTVSSLANQRFTYLMLKEQYKDVFDIKFLYYYCFKLDDYCKECLNQGNFASVDMKKFSKFTFPLVPLEIQR